MTWTPDSAALIVTADGGRGPLFRIELEAGTVSMLGPASDPSATRLTGDDGAYTDPQVSPDGAHVYALRSAIDAPPAPVRLDAHVPSSSPSRCSVRPRRPSCPLRAWLVLWAHGGPPRSWNAWQWRRNPG